MGNERLPPGRSRSETVVYEAHVRNQTMLHPGVPEHLRNAPTKLMKELGYGADYRYAHDEAEGYAAGESYLPDGMPAVHWYQPVARGLEQKIAEKLAHLRELDAQAKKKR